MCATLVILNEVKDLRLPLLYFAVKIGKARMPNLRRLAEK
jgi:hypothetical protein